MPEPFGVYVHWPFCQSKCPYCDFNSHVRFAPPDEPRFLRAFEREIAWTRERTGARTVSSVFFGGGTPSLMSPATVAGLLAAIDRAFPIAPGAEITLEANPGSVEATRFQGYRAAGVNRVSLGVQALNDADLKALGRLHSVADARAALAIATRTFARVSFDLIYARPHQTAAAWEAELSTALEMQVGHLSLYQLTIEEGTPFAGLAKAGKLKVPEPELADELFALTETKTAAAGLPAYEISNHARAGEESQHNLLYWHYGEYAGVGPGAHGRLVMNGARSATSTERSPEAWLARVEAQGHGLIEQTPLAALEMADEMLLMGLRLSDGVDLTRLEQLTGLRPGHRAISDLTQQGLIVPHIGSERLRATQAGRFVLNELVLQLAHSFEPAGPDHGRVAMRQVLA